MRSEFLQAFALSVVLALLTLCQPGQAQQQNQSPSSSPVDDTRIARLVGLAKIWGAVKYFHPFLAYREIDWDKALIEAIPRVNAAKRPQEYEAAIQQLLAVLNDRSTHAEIESGTKTTPSSETVVVDSKEPVRTESGVLIIDATQIVEAFAQDNTLLSGFVENVNQAVGSAKGVVIDARGGKKSEDLDAYYFDVFLRRILPLMLDSDVVLGSIRYRVHNGYATQTGTGARFYYSAFSNSAPETFPGRSKSKTPPIVFVVNENSPTFSEILSGMQSANRSVVVQEGEQPPEMSSGSFTMKLPDNVRVKMRTAELVNPDGSLDFQPDTVVAKSASTDAAMNEAIRAVQENRVGQPRNRKVSNFTPQISQHDNAYPEMDFPNTEYRLLALFRFWNVINYFYPYRSLVGTDWGTLLQRYIPKFEANRDLIDYQLTVRELVTEIHDSHGSVQNGTASNEKLGMFMPPILTRYIEHQSVVTDIFDPKLPVNRGDIILAVDGEPIEKRREYLARFIAASTSQSLMRNVHSRLLRGQKDSVVKLRLQGPSGEVREVGVARSLSVTDARLFGPQRTSPGVQVLPRGYGYVDLARLQVGEVDKMFETIRNTSAVIFDMRGYPNGTAWTIAPRLTEKNNVVAALFSRPFLEATLLSESEYADSASYSFEQKLPAASGPVYKGKVVMLINEDAISQSEHTCLFFEAATDITFIGTPTAGANGDVTYMILPGNLSVSFTGHSVRHADGRQLQRLGIQPTIRVEPTIGGTIAGRDEILEGAITFLENRVRN